VNSGVTNLRLVFRERVEMREAIFDYEGDRAQKESDIWWASGETKRKWIERSVVCEWVVSSKEKTRDLSLVIVICNLRCISRHWIAYFLEREQSGCLG
jgi:hypothetical protein